MDRVLAEALGVALVTEGPRSPQEVMALGGELAHAAGLADTENLDLAATRLRAVKRTVVRLNRPQMHRQAAFNRSILTIGAQLTHFVAGLVAAQEQHRTAIASRLADAQVRLRALEAEVARLTAELQHHGRQLTADVEELTEGQRALVSGVDRLRRSIEDGGAAAGGAHTAEQERRRHRQDAVYERFEEAYRGTEADIRERVAVYVPDVEFLAQGTAPLLDVGCGRGEWLTLLRERGIPSQGVDLNETMVARCVGAGLDVRFGDAIDALLTAPPGSLGAVTAFHVVEHLRMADLVAFLEAARSALRPGGVIILETPNPTNLLVGAATFYRDPTHVRPLHPDLLGFLVAELGFADVDTRFLHPIEEEADRGDADDQLGRDLAWAFKGPQDYAVVARVPDA